VGCIAYVSEVRTVSIFKLYIISEKKINSWGVVVKS